MTDMMGRPDGAPMGKKFAQTHVTGWLVNDCAVVNRARSIMAGTDGYRLDLTPVNRLRAFVDHILYTDDGSTYRSTHVREFGHLALFESHVPALVRESFAREDFDGIDWQAVAAELEDDE